MAQPLQIRRTPAVPAHQYEKLAELYRERISRWEKEHQDGFAAIQAAIPLRGRQLVVPPASPDPDWKVIARWGRVVDNSTEVLHEMAASNCHENSAALWEDAMIAVAGGGIGATMRIETGFALSEDGLWREHTWVRDISGAHGHGVLIETTVKRVQYWGIAFTQPGSWIFATQQLGRAPLPKDATTTENRETLARASLLVSALAESGTATPLTGADREGDNFLITTA